MTVIEAMGRWLDGSEPVPTVKQFERQFPDIRRWSWPSGKELELPIEERRALIHKRLDREVELIGERDAFIKHYGFAIPSAEALEAIAALSPLIEIGAGTGAWAKLISMRGADIIATDPATERRYGFCHGAWFRMQPHDAVAAVTQWPERNVFCSWPSLDGFWLRDAAAVMEGGRYLAVIRESATANDETWQYIEEQFEGAGDVSIPNWVGMHDYLQIWRKKPWTPVQADPGFPL